MIKLFFQFLKILGGNFRFKILSSFALSIMAGLLEVLGITLIFPLVSLVSDPTIVERNLYLNWAYNVLGFQNQKSMIYAIALGIGFIFILKNLYMIFFQAFQLRVIRSWRNKICDEFMAKYLESPFAYHLHRKSGEMINTLNSTIYFVLNSYVLSTVMLFSHTAVVIMLLGFLMWKFFVPSLISGAILIIITVVQAKFIRKQTAEINEHITKAREQNLSVLTQAISAVRETKIFRREKFFAETYHQSNAVISNYDSKSVLMQYIPTYISEIVLVTAIIIMCCLVLSQAYTPIGGMANLAVLAAVAFRMAPMINRSLFSYSQIRISAGATQELLNEYKTLQELKTEQFHQSHDKLAFQNSLVMKDVSFAYDGKSDVLKDINCEIFKGEFIGIVGPSGAGKTTLADLLLGLLHPSSGRYFVDGVTIESCAT